MLGVALLYATSRAFSILLGSLGVIFVYISFLKPDVGADAIILLGAALALIWATRPDNTHSSNGRTHRPESWRGHPDLPLLYRLTPA